MDRVFALIMLMERIIKHIERLLLLHDCVIIPDFGGFVLQSVPAVYLDEEHSFTPARKEIVFNPTLTHNDGLLSESYMQAYSVDFHKAQQFVRKDVTEMKEILDNYAELQMGAIGFFIKEDDRLIFMPGKNSDVLFSTQSYGLPIFHYLPLSARHPVMISTLKVPEAEIQPETEISPAKTEKQGKNVIYRIPVTRTFLRVVGATAAAILLFLFISTPVTDVNKASYSASFIPQEIMPKKTADDIVSDAFSASGEFAYNASDHSGYVTEHVAVPGVKEATDKPDPVSDMENPTNAETMSEKAGATSEKAETASKTTETKSKTAGARAGKTGTKSANTGAKTRSRSTTTTTRSKSSSSASNSSASASKSAETKASASNSTAGGANYYVIIGSFNNRTQAQNYIRQLKGVDMGNVGILVRDGRVRVYAQGFVTEHAAQTYMNKLRQNPKHAQAWTYKAK